ncbi:MAG: outer membrane beta-barrel protein [Cyclobacteriaceae bacterium]
MKQTFFVTLLSLILLCLTGSVEAQSFKRKNARDPFRSSQGFIGLWGGTNFSNAKVEKSYTDFASIEAIEDDLLLDQKEYGSFSSHTGFQLGLSAAFSFNKLFTIACSPSYKKIVYQYESNFSWSDPENPANTLAYTYGHEQDLFYVSLPLLVRYSPAGKKVRPYLQVGAYYDRLLNARKSVSTSGTDQASGGKVNFELSTQSTDISHLYIRSHAGLLGGAGVNYNMGTLLLFVDAQYRHPFHQITNVRNRYSGSRDLLGFGNVLDDVTLRNVEVSFGCYFPLKFLTKDFSPVIL